jgi:hypothetical protein
MHREMRHLEAIVGVTHLSLEALEVVRSGRTVCLEAVEFRHRTKEEETVVKREAGSRWENGTTRQHALTTELTVSPTLPAFSMSSLRRTKLSAIALEI